MPLGPMKTKAQKQAGMGQVMGEFKRGQLHSGSKTGPKVKDRAQAIAIGLSQTKQSKYARGGLTEKTEPDVGTAGLTNDIRTPDEAVSLLPMMPELPPEYLQTIDQLRRPNFFLRQDRESGIRTPRQGRRRGPSADGIDEVFDTSRRGQSRIRYYDGGGGGDGGGGDGSGG